MGGWVAGPNGNKVNPSPTEAGLSLAKKLDDLQKITIPVGSTGSGWCRDQRESLGKISILTIFGQSRQISVSTTLKIVVSTKSRSRQFTNYESRTNLDLDNFGTLSLVPVSISTILKI